jgi:septal ring factor EnvC (AmiA/AmiB activator)
MNDTPTPRTNRFYASFADGECIPNQDEWLALCESLESELTAACQEIDMLKSKYADHHAEAERLTSEINAVTEQRDRLKDALRKLADCDWVITLPNRMDAVRTIAAEALAAVEGGSDEPVTLIHNGVGIADMYQPGELEKELRSMTGAEPQKRIIQTTV